MIRIFKDTANENMFGNIDDPRDHGVKFMPEPQTQKR